MQRAKTRAKSIGIMALLIMAPMLAFTASANPDGGNNNGNNGGTDANGNEMNLSWLDNLTAEQIDYSVDVNLYGSDLEIRLSSTEMYDSSVRQMFDVDGDSDVDWADSNLVNGMVNQYMQVNLSDLPEVKLNGIPVTALIGQWCNYEDIVPYQWDATVNVSDMQVRFRCEFTLLVEEFNSSTGILEVNTVGDEEIIQGNVNTNSWHGLNIVSVMNTLPDGTTTNFNNSSDGYWWLWVENGLQGQFMIEFDIDYEEYDVCQEMDGYSWDEALALAQNLSNGTTSATIVIINSQEELELVSQILGNNGTWVGATQNLDTTLGEVEPSGGWTNLDGTSLNDSFWAYGEPNDWGGDHDNGGEDLVELWPWSGLNDIDGNAYLPVLIEYTNSDGTKEYELFGGWEEVSCEDQEDWWDWQDMEWVDYSLWLDMIGDELEVVIRQHESVDVDDLLNSGDLDNDGELSATELETLELFATNELNISDMPAMMVEGESLNQLNHYGCEIWMPSNANDDGTINEYVDMAHASLECKWVYQQQIAYDDNLNLTVEVEEYNSTDEAGWLSMGLGWGAVQKGYVITDVYDTEEAITEIQLEDYNDDYWGGEHRGDFGTLIMELERLNEPFNDSDWDDHDDNQSGEMDYVDYIAWSNVDGDIVQVELIRLEMVEATQLASLDSDGDGIVSDAEIEFIEQMARDEMDPTELPPIYVNGDLLNNLSEWNCELIMLGDEMDANNLFDVAELECWFLFEDEFDFDNELIIKVEIEEYDSDSDEQGLVMAELGEQASENGWWIEDVYDMHATQSGVQFYLTDDSLWEADHQGNHGTYVIKLLNGELGDEMPEDDEGVEDLPPECSVAWALSSEMMDMSGEAQVVDPSGSMDVTLGAGTYDLYVYCADPNGDDVDVTVTIAGIEIGTFSSPEVEGYAEFEVPEDALANVMIEIAWISTNYSGNVSLDITADGSQGGFVVGNIVPGFSGLLAMVSIVGALAIVGRRVGNRLE